MQLNDAQRDAVAAVTGPVCIIAGAGTGKTTTVTNRIAQQVQSGAFTARDILAVTFTAKAARELRERLTSLGTSGVEARTFHSTALWMLSFLWQPYESTTLPRVLDSKYRLLAPIARRLPMPYRFRPVRDLASALEFRANSQIPASQLSNALNDAGIEPPMPDDLLIQLVEQYDAAKQADGSMDFEDVLTRCGDLLETHADARERIQKRFRAFTVDEYQDVNPLQQRLLDLWVGDRQDVCVVGDDHQTIYTFTGAHPGYLLNFTKRYPAAHIVTLTNNYRSATGIIDVANTVSRRLGGYDKQLVAAAAHSTESPISVLAESFTDPDDEAAWISKRCLQLHNDGIDWSQMAVLYRTRSQSTRFEQALIRSAIPVCVRGRGLLQRDAWYQLERLVQRTPVPGFTPFAEHISSLAQSRGYLPTGVDTDAGDDEMTRQSDFTAIIELARRHERELGDDVSTSSFQTLLQQQFGHENDANGVQLLTLHSVKGLEYDAVFLPELIGGVLPYWKGKRKAPIEEERRLFFVGVTRARRMLHISWSTGGKRTPSIFLEDAGLIDASVREAATKARSTGAGKKAAPPAEVPPEHQPLFEALRAWRIENSAGKPAYIVLGNRSLMAICEGRPTTLATLGTCHGIGPTKLERYGDAILDVVRSHSTAD